MVNGLYTVVLHLAFRLFTWCLNEVKRSKRFCIIFKNTYNYIYACKKSSILSFIHIYPSNIYLCMYIYLCMWKEQKIDIYACNISSVHIYKYNKLKYTNLSIQNLTRFTSCSPKQPFKQLFSPFNTVYLHFV